MIRIRCAASPGEVRIALTCGDTLEAYTVWRPGAPDGLGDIHVGRIIARVPAMAGAFVALPGAEGFLPDSEMPSVPEGALVRVRVVRTAQGGKGPRLARAGDGSVLEGASQGLIARGETPLQRLAAHHPDAPIEIDDPVLLAALRPNFPGRLRLVPRSFSDALEDEISALAEPWCDLPGGLRAGFFPTPALTAIDIDGGASTGVRDAKHQAQFAANRAALPALAREIRLRNLSGAILVDFAGLPAKRRAALAPDLAQCLAADPQKPRLLGFTQLGLAEILRPRTTPPLHELATGPHAAGLAALRCLASRLATTPAGLPAPACAPRLRAAPAVIAALQADSAALADFARLSPAKLILQSDPSLPDSTCRPDIG